MITANRRAKATIAFFIPRRLAICIAQAYAVDAYSYFPVVLTSACGTWPTLLSRPRMSALEGKQTFMLVKLGVAQARQPLRRSYRPAAGNADAKDRLAALPSK
jgi:hypothetical protein